MLIDNNIQIRSSLTHVMLNGWMVDFNHSLDSFEHQISGTRKVLDFCAELPQPVTIMFTSSISVATKWDVTAGPVPEQPIEDPEVASASGYSASKYVTEQVGLQVHYTSGVRSHICDRCFPKRRTKV